MNGIVAGALRLSPAAGLSRHVSGRVRSQGTGRGARLASTTRAAADSDDIEAIEQRLKGKRGKKEKEGYFDSYPTKESKIPKGMWETDPASWDAMPVEQRAWKLWTGEPGMMYWMNQGSLYGAGHSRSSGCSSDSCFQPSGSTSSRTSRTRRPGVLR